MKIKVPTFEQMGDWVMKMALAVALFLMACFVAALPYAFWQDYADRALCIEKTGLPCEALRGGR